MSLAKYKWVMKMLENKFGKEAISELVCDFGFGYGICIKKMTSTVLVRRAIKLDWFNHEHKGKCTLEKVVNECTGEVSDLCTKPLKFHSINKLPNKRSIILKFIKDTIKQFDLDKV